MIIPWYLMAKGKGGGGYKTASGPIVSISDALTAPLRSLLVNIEPLQEGTGDPSPENVRPISGWSAVNVWRTGKNLFNPDSEANEWVTWQGALTTDANSKSNRIKSKAGDVFTLSNANTTDNYNLVLLLAFLDGNDNVLGTRYISNVGTKSVTATAPANTEYVLAAITQWSNSANQQLELGSTATPYEPYSGNQYTIQLGQTVYGGTLDVTNGVLTVDRAMVTFTGADSENWGLYATYPNHFQIIVSPSNKKNVNEETNAISNAYTARIGMSNNNVSVQEGIFSADGDRIRIKDTTCATVAEFKAKLQSLLNGLQVCYVLATPITVPLTPQEISTLQGQNNVWTDSGGVTVEYLSAGGANPDLMKLAVAFMGGD